MTDGVWIGVLALAAVSWAALTAYGVWAAVMLRRIDRLHGRWRAGTAVERHMAGEIAMWL